MNIVLQYQRSPQKRNIRAVKPKTQAKVFWNEKLFSFGLKFNETVIIIYHHWCNLSLLAQDFVLFFVCAINHTTSENLNIKGFFYKVKDFAFYINSVVHFTMLGNGQFDSLQKRHQNSKLKDEYSDETFSLHENLSWRMVLKLLLFYFRVYFWLWNIV